MSTLKRFGNNVMFRLFNTQDREEETNVTFNNLKLNVLMNK